MLFFRDKTFGVFGLGKAGKAAVAALLAGGAEVYCWDDSLDREESRKEQEARSVDRASPEPLPIAQRSIREQGHYKDWPWPELSALVLSPGVPLSHPVVKMAEAAGCEVLGEVELLYRACPDATYIGITGTNGKSTTTALIGHILTEAGMHPQVGGNLGTPALALDVSVCSPASPTARQMEHSSGLGRADALPFCPSPLFVLEMSSYQLDLCRTVRFNVAVWLNITPDHLDRHGDMAGYIAAKAHIFDHQTGGDTVVIGIDDPYSEVMAKMLIADGVRNVVPVTVGGLAGMGIEVEDGLLRDRRDGTELDLTGCKGLRGAHNWQNAAAAYVACRTLDVMPEIISEAMRSFPGLAHRMEWVGEHGGVTYINDSKATNADSTSKALMAYPGDVYWIVGGRAKAGGIESLVPFFPRIRHAYLIGEAAGEFAATLEGHVPYTQCGTLEVATQKASADAQAAGSGFVLLSPACASWDQWPNFEVRGEAFKGYVRHCVSQTGEAA